MSMVYNQIYKCRKCGAEFCPVTVHTETVMYIELNNFLNRVNGELEWDHKEMPLAPRLYRAHTCPNGDIGVGDFMGKDGAPHHLAELELLARAQKDWYYAMMSYIMGGDSDAEEESK